MANEPNILIDVPPPRARPHDDDDDPRPQDCAPMANPLPPGLVMTEWAVGLLREFLERKGLSHYTVCHGTDLDLEDVERHLDALGEAQAAWQSLPAASPAGQPLMVITHGSTASKIWRAGALHLERHELVIARWYWVDEIEVFRTLWLIAVPTASTYLTLRDELRRHHRRCGARMWQIIRNGWQPTRWLAREAASASSQLLLPAEMRRRVEAEIIGFFSSDVAALYEQLNVPYRRGVLFHGPPGNGKTSLIRFIGSSLPEVPMLVLRPSAHFNSDTLHDVMKRWSAVAPAVLIIEDLDWLLKEVNISAFLNALDGIDGESESIGDESMPSKRHLQPRKNRGGGDAVAGGRGLLLIATTNHPDRLDPAVNNRPGRFDIVIEVPPPDRALRRQFFVSRLEDVNPQFIDALADAASGLSFAHLQEVLRASALAVIHNGRMHRSQADLLAAVATVREANESAERGFPAKPDVPFGLAARRSRP